MEDHHLHSPSQIAMTGHDFSPEDIQDLLGGVLVSDSAVPPPGYHDANMAAAAPEPVSSQIRAAARTERKRKLEKQRRSDVNKQFAELSTVLRQIEAEAPDQVVRLLPAAYSPANRVDLMARTVALLKNLFESHKKQKAAVADLEGQLELAKKAGEEAAAKYKEALMAPQAVGGNKVMMMVPMMIGDTNNNNNAAVPMMQPWMPATANTETTTTTPTTSMPFVMAPNAQWMMPSPMTAAAAPPPAKKAKTTAADSPQAKQESGNLAHCA